MSNKCPKCNEKLSPLYMKQTCPKCNTNLVYYDLDKRLASDHEKAMREQAAVDRVLNNIKTSGFGGPAQIIRFILLFTPLLWMCLPMYTTADGTELNLLSVIMGIINGSLPFDKILSDKSYLFPFITMVCVIVFSLAVIISSLFSIGRKALIRNIFFSCLNIAVFLLCNSLSVAMGTSISYGVIIISCVYVLEIFMHKIVDKKINQPTNE